MTTRNTKAVGAQMNKGGSAMLDEAMAGDDGYIQPTYIDGGLTKLETLAMQIYVQECSNRPMYAPVSLDEYAQFSIDAANIFFDELEKGNG